MNKDLLEQIAKHIFSNLSIIKSNFINYDKSKSLISKDFLLDKTLDFYFDNDKAANKKIWGCQISSEQNELKILLADCSQDKNIEEFYLIVQLKNAPAYGIYFSNIFDKTKDYEEESIIACNVNNKGWMTCNTYLQATFLAGMEQLKDLGFNWNKCQDYSEQYNLLLSFVKYHDSYLEENNEG